MSLSAPASETHIAVRPSPWLALVCALGLPPMVWMVGLEIVADGGVGLGMAVFWVCLLAPILMIFLTAVLVLKAYLLRPRIVVGPEGVSIPGPFGTTRVPFAALTGSEVEESRGGGQASAMVALSWNDGAPRRTVVHSLFVGREAVARLVAALDDREIP